MMVQNMNTSELIKERYQQLPQEIRDAVTASDLPTKMKTIASNHGLMIDQVGILQNEILFVMLGLEPSSDFVNNMSKELGIKRELAEKITIDVNRLIFDSIKNYLREREESVLNEQINEQKTEQEEKLATISSIEQVGGFSIEKPAPVSINKITPTDREAALEHLENPPGQVDRGGTSVNSAHETHTEPLVDHLLQNSVSAGAYKQHVEPHVPDNLPIVAATPFTQTSINPPPKAPEVPKPAPRTGPDPYREMPK